MKKFSGTFLRPKKFLRGWFPFQNILRYLYLLTLSEITGACFGYLGSLGKRDKLLCSFLRFIPFIKIFYALLKYLILDLFEFNLLHLFLWKILAIFFMRFFKFPRKGSNFSGYFPKFSRYFPIFSRYFQNIQPLQHDFGSGSCYRP